MVRKRFLLLLLFLSCSFPHEDYSNIRVTEVIDGDTVKLSNGKLLRYIGIDTPEIRSKRNGEFYYDPQPFSLEAKDYNRHLVEGKTIRVEFDLEKYDRYGRLLGYCFIGDDFVNLKLIEKGYAVIYTYPPNVKYTKLFAEVQTKARNQNKGVWASYALIDSSQAYRYVNQIRSVRGRVLSVFESDKCIFLNFGKSGKKDFKVVIFKRSLDGFRQRNIDPLKFYKGQLVEVSGRVKEYNGPEIIVGSPYEIRILDAYQ